jgi:spore germination protein GerM
VIPRNLLITVVIMLVAAIGMGVYVVRMRRRATQIEATSAGTRPVAPPVSGPTEQVNLYVANDDSGMIRAQSTRLRLSTGRQERAQDLLRALIGIYLEKNSPHPLPPGSDIRDVYIADPGIAVIDINSALAAGHRSGVLVEELTVASLVETLSGNVPGITKVKILVDGKSRDTLAGHADLSSFYDVSQMGEMLTRLQSP